MNGGFLVLHFISFVCHYLCFSCSNTLLQLFSTFVAALLCDMLWWVTTALKSWSQMDADLFPLCCSLQILFTSFIFSGCCHFHGLFSIPLAFHGFYVYRTLKEVIKDASFHHHRKKWSRKNYFSRSVWSMLNSASISRTLHFDKVSILTAEHH